MLNTALVEAGTMSIGNVVLLGIGTVFVGLICIVVLCEIMGAIVRLFSKKEAPAAPVAAPAAPAGAQIPNRAELVAAISCCVAEELGKDVSAIRIVSLKKLG